jgi:TonB family protein
MTLSSRTSGKSITAAIVVALFLWGCILSCVTERQARAQGKPPSVSGDRERGVELYRKGDLGGAIKVLNAAVKKDKSDADAWHLLGIIYYGNGDARNAHKAFETEIMLRPNSAIAHAGMGYALLLEDKFSAAALEAERALSLDAKNADAHYILGVKYFRETNESKALDEAREAIKLNPKFAPAYLLKIQLLLGTYEWAIVYRPDETKEERASRLREARDDLDLYLKLYPLTPNRELLDETMSSLNNFLLPKNPESGNAAEQVAPAAYTPQNVTEKARILSRPEPVYPPLASQRGVHGVVILRAVFGADGRVRTIHVFQPLPYGLTEVSIKAARAIKFKPAIKDGHPVSQYIQIEYNFMQ